MHSDKLTSTILIKPSLLPYKMKFVYLPNTDTYKKLCGNFLQLHYKTQLKPQFIDYPNNIAIEQSNYINPTKSYQYKYCVNCKTHLNNKNNKHNLTQSNSETEYAHISHNTVDKIKNLSRRKNIIIDSGATSHMLNSIDVFQKSFFSYDNNNSKVSLGNNNYKLDITGHGPTALLVDALYVPNLSVGLLSISKLSDTNHVTLFKANKVYIYII